MVVQDRQKGVAATGCGPPATRGCRAGSRHDGHAIAELLDQCRAALALRGTGCTTISIAIGNIAAMWAGEAWQYRRAPGRARG
jgi:hypothetical protein